MDPGSTPGISTVSEKDFMALTEMIRNPPPPTQELIDLMKEYK